ncbi:hypothetical protein HDU79_003786 [Rhizoclosmatium sp. JEL0117]|nr:hypothetical protein HDU79_003786 [Rhizoclosmatium sp. JEL0117]
MNKKRGHDPDDEDADYQAGINSDGGSDSGMMEPDSPRTATTTDVRKLLRAEFGPNHLKKPAPVTTHTHGPSGSLSMRVGGGTPIRMPVSRAQQEAQQDLLQVRTSSPAPTKQPQKKKPKTDPLQQLVVVNQTAAKKKVAAKKAEDMARLRDLEPPVAFPNGPPPKPSKPSKPPKVRSATPKPQTAPRRPNPPPPPTLPDQSTSLTPWQPNPSSGNRLIILENKDGLYFPHRNSAVPIAPFHIDQLSLHIDFNKPFHQSYLLANGWTHTEGFKKWGWVFLNGNWLQMCAECNKPDSAKTRDFVYCGDAKDSNIHFVHTECSIPNEKGRGLCSACLLAHDPGSDKTPLNAPPSSAEILPDAVSVLPTTGSTVSTKPASEANGILKNKYNAALAEEQDGDDADDKPGEADDDDDLIPLESEEMEEVFPCFELLERDEKEAIQTYYDFLAHLGLPETFITLLMCYIHDSMFDDTKMLWNGDNWAIMHTNVTSFAELMKSRRTNNTMRTFKSSFKHIVTFINSRQNEFPNREMYKNWMKPSIALFVDFFAFFERAPNTESKRGLPRFSKSMIRKCRTSLGLLFDLTAACHPEERNPTENESISKRMKQAIMVVEAENSKNTNFMQKSGLALLNSKDSYTDELKRWWQMNTRNRKGFQYYAQDILMLNTKHRSDSNRGYELGGIATHEFKTKWGTFHAGLQFFTQKGDSNGSGDVKVTGYLPNPEPEKCAFTAIFVNVTDRYQAIPLCVQMFGGKDNGDRFPDLKKGWQSWHKLPLFIGKDPTKKMHATTHYRRKKDSQVAFGIDVQSVTHGHRKLGPDEMNAAGLSDTDIKKFVGWEVSKGSYGVYVNLLPQLAAMLAVFKLTENDPYFVFRLQVELPDIIFKSFIPELHEFMEYIEKSEGGKYPDVNTEIFCKSLCQILKYGIPGFAEVYCNWGFPSQHHYWQKVLPIFIDPEVSAAFSVYAKQVKEKVAEGKANSLSFMVEAHEKYGGNLDLEAVKGMLILLNDKVGSVKVMSEEYHKAKEEVVKLKTEVEMEKAARAAAEQARITAEQDNAKLLERIRLLEKGISLATPTKPVFKPIVPKTAQPVPVPPTVPATSVPIPSLPNTPTRSTTDLLGSSLQSTPQQSSALSQLPSSVPVSTTSSNKYTDWRRFSSTGLEDSLGLFIAYDDGPFDKSKPDPSRIPRVSVKTLGQYKFCDVVPLWNGGLSLLESTYGAKWGKKPNFTTDKAGEVWRSNIKAIVAYLEKEKAANNPVALGALCGRLQQATTVAGFSNYKSAQKVAHKARADGKSTPAVKEAVHKLNKEAAKSFKGTPQIRKLRDASPVY